MVNILDSIPGLGLLASKNSLQPCAVSSADFSGYFAIFTNVLHFDCYLMFSQCKLEDLLLLQNTCILSAVYLENHNPDLTFWTTNFLFVFITFMK